MRAGYLVDTVWAGLGGAGCPCCRPQRFTHMPLASVVAERESGHRLWCFGQ